MEAVLIAEYRDWDVTIHCARANAGFYRSVAYVRAPISLDSDCAGNRIHSSTLLETPGNFYPSAVLSNEAALASARRYIEAEEGPRNLH